MLPPPSRCHMHETYSHPFERLFPLENRRNAFRTPGNYKRLNSFHNYTISMYHASAFFTAIFYFPFLFFLLSCYSIHMILIHATPRAAMQPVRRLRTRRTYFNSRDPTGRDKKMHYLISIWRCKKREKAEK